MRTIKVFGLVCIFIIFCQGCASIGENANQPNKQDAAVILRTAARGAATVAISKDADNKTHVALALSALEVFLVGNDYTPGALTKALEPTFKELKNPEIALALNTVIDLYDVFYGRYVKGQISRNETALLFLTALRDGAKQALEAQP